MPKDSFGITHLNQQRADYASRMPGKPAPKSEAAPKGEKPAGGTGNSTTLHDHGDGTFSTDSGGTKTEHPHIGHALVHMGSKHAGGKHMHAHKSSHGGITTHKANDQGQVEGPNEHDSADAAAEDMASAMGDDEGAEGEDPRMAHQSHDDGSGLTGF